jgi:hypothetical protein
LCPFPDCPGRVHRDRCRILLDISIQAFGNGFVAEPRPYSPFEYRGDDVRAFRVWNEPGLGFMFGAFRRHRVRDLIGDVSVGWFTDVVTLLGMCLKSTPRLFQHFQHVPFRDTLLGASVEHLAGFRTPPPSTCAVKIDRLIGGQQRHPGLFEAVFDQGAVVGTPRDAINRFADHHVEAPVSPGGLV